MSALPVCFFPFTLHGSAPGYARSQIDFCVGNLIGQVELLEVEGKIREILPDERFGVQPTMSIGSSRRRQVKIAVTGAARSLEITYTSN